MVSKLKLLFFWSVLMLCCLPVIKAPMALTIGAAMGISSLGIPSGFRVSCYSKELLQISVIGLGFGVGIQEILKTGQSAFVYTVISIIITMFTGYIIGIKLNMPYRICMLLSFGTAICGGSAIAAMSPVIKADTEETGIAIATIFTLNSIALVIFPFLGHWIGMNQQQFGLWSALAIHDTSSVVGATSAFGEIALAIGTTVKLTRALWIIPFVLIVSWLTKSDGKVKFPVFIIGFITAAYIKTRFPQLNHIWFYLNMIAKQSLVVTLFIIGINLNIGILKKTGIKPLLHGLILWFIVSVISAYFVITGWIT